MDEADQAPIRIRALGLICLPNSWMDLFHQFHRHCAAEQLVQPAERLLLAVSGGVDSCVLLELFCQLREQWQLQLALAHVNHQLRGRESDEDEMFVKGLAEKLGLPFFSQRIETSTYARHHKLSVETAARELRYQALENFREDWQARAVVTAHTLDDQAETILDHILRGCGLAGLAGMAADSKFSLKAPPPDSSTAAGRKPALRILRPLLPFARAQIEEYARFRQLQWREDRTNTDTQFRRNRIRHELLPLIKARFNPQIARSLEHLSNIAVAAENYLLAEAESCLPEIIKERQSGKIILDLELFWKYFPIIRSYVVRAALQQLLPPPVEPTFEETSRILNLLERGHDEKPATGKRYIWRGQIEVTVDHDGAVFWRRGQSAEGRGRRAKGDERRSELSLVAHCPSLVVKIGERCEIPGTAVAILVERKELPRDWREQVNDHSQFVDAEKVQGELRVRFPRPGDRFVPLRARDHGELNRGAKKLSDFFTDLKVPLHRRQAVPILESDAIIWICGYRLDNRFKITPATRSVLHLQLLQQENLRDGNRENNLLY